MEHTPFSPLMNSADFMDALRKEMGMDGAMTRDWGKETGKVFASYVEDPYKNKRSNGKETNQDEKVIKDISTITGAVGNIMGGIQNLGLELPEGITQAIGMIQTISGILTAILTITTAINATQEVQTAVSAIPFLHTGGVVRAATGTVVPGNFGFDAVPAMLTSGEVVLNKAQQGALASELQDSGINGLHIVGEIDCEKIILGVNRVFTRKGEGELVTWKN
jgi:hypothetical protein